MSDEQDRKIKRLEKDFKELNILFVKNDEELRGKIRDIRIANAAGVTATEFTLAHRLAVTMDVVLHLIPEGRRVEIEREIDRRVSEVPNTTKVAERLAAKLYNEDKDI